jgi:hypothetical protein
VLQHFGEVAGLNLQLLGQTAKNNEGFLDECRLADTMQLTLAEIARREPSLQDLAYGSAERIARRFLVDVAFVSLGYV